MNKTIIRILALVILASPWIYIGEALRDVLLIISSIAILLATIDMTKKKKESAEA